MKKILAMVLALMMLAVTAVCYAETAEEPECVEVWDTIAMYKDGEQAEEGTYPMISLFLYNDYTLELESGESAFTGTFEMTSDPQGYLANVNGEELPFIYDAETNTLSLTDPNGNVAVFGLRVDLPAELNAESIDEFQGTWHITSVIKEGRWISLDTEEGQTVKNDYFHLDDPTIVIEGNKVTMLEQMEGTAEFVDGALVVTAEGNTFNIDLTEGDGIVCWVEEDVVTSITHLYCDK